WSTTQVRAASMFPVINCGIPWLLSSSMPMQTLLLSRTSLAIAVSLRLRGIAGYRTAKWNGTTTGQLIWWLKELRHHRHPVVRNQLHLWVYRFGELKRGRIKRRAKPKEACPSVAPPPRRSGRSPALPYPPGGRKYTSIESFGSDILIT